MDSLRNPSDLRRACVFCGSSDGADPKYLLEAVNLGHSLATAGWGLVYGGASIGLMGAVANAALAAGGQVIGVIPMALAANEIAHDLLTRLYVVGSMHERKAQMAALSDAFIALPGGYGTLDEFLEILTWAQLEIHQKPCILVNTAGYYDRLLSFLDYGVEQAFIRQSNRLLLLVAKDARGALALIEQTAPPTATLLPTRTQLLP